MVSWQGLFQTIYLFLSGRLLNPLRLIIVLNVNKIYVLSFHAVRDENTDYWHHFLDDSVSIRRNCHKFMSMRFDTIYFNLFL